MFNTANTNSVNDTLNIKMEKVMLTLITKSQKNLPFSLEVKDLCELLPHSSTKIYLMLENGELPGRKIGGKWVISRDQFLAWYYGINRTEEILVV
ncbi:MAG: helix-turn-helix domain-containing protein [Bacillota bacterium]